MKITRVETIPVRVPLRQDLAIRSGRGGSHTVSPFLIVKVHTDAGLVGLGEASCTPRWSGEDQFTAAHFINHYIAPAIVGSDPRDIEQVSTRFRSIIAGNYFTKAAVEMALWDLAGKAADKPVYALLGGAVREGIPTKWSVSGVEPERAADIACWAVAQGFKAMKVKVGIDPANDLERVRAVRNAVGADVKLGVDANGGWDVKTAVETIRAMAEFRIAFAEQPVPADDIAGLAEVRKSIAVPVIADESVYTLQDAMTLARLETTDVFSIYVGKAGGIGPARKIAWFAETAGLKAVVGSNLELGVGTAAMVHLALATKGVAAEEFPCDIIGPFYYEDDIVAEPLPIRPGEARANDKPGLGVELDEEKVRRYRVC